ncbi:Hydin [Symbiodinium sp. CCMP2592]|nr:Hydin [Symbiodinium sp. CCMP2592]
MGETCIWTALVVSFQLNNSGKNVLRFQFPETLPAPLSDCLQITPSVGHILPGMKKSISFTYRPTESMQADVPLPVQVAGITPDGDVQDQGDWDDTRMEEVEGEEPAPVSEPAHAVVEGTAREMPLRILAAADQMAYECGTERIHFSPTVLFQTRLHRFTVANPSKIALPYNWRILPATGADASAGSQAYAITPVRGTIAAGSTQEFQIRFAPKEVHDFAGILDSRMPIEDPLRIRLQASALRPWCHFEVPISDYRSRRQAETPLDPKYQVIEFESLGTRVRNTKRFYVLNPTSDTYEFHWMPEESDKRETEDPFRCLTKRGTILPGKKYEMLFEYLPADTEIHESRWLFSVPGKQASQAFVLVGTVKEPRMGLDRPCIKFNRLLLGGKAIEKVCIVNKEHLPFSFAFDHKSYEADGPAAISLSPDSGVVGPGASFPIEVKFSPNEERFFNYNVVCNIKRKEKPLLLNIKGEGYKIHTKLVLEEADREGRVLHPGVKELLDFGDMQVQERQSFTLKLSSPTFERDHAAAAEAADEQVAVSYDFIWQLRSATGRLMTPQAEGPPYLTITPVHGVITIEYSPTDAHKLDGASLRMLIPSGPDDASYTLGLAGRAYRPMLDFSTQNHDFGPCFVKRTAASAGEPSQGKTPLERLDLTVTNRGMTDCWLSTTFQRTSYLDVQLPASMVEAGSSLVVPIIFTPKDYVDYRECIEFVVNDCTKYYVNLRGQGCPLQLEAASLAMQNVDFGVAVGNTGVSRSLRVVNRSVRPVEFSFQDADGKLAEKCVSWSPTMPVKLRPKEQTSFELRYKPSFPMPVFKLPLVASCNFGIDMQICHVTGSCHAAEVRLSEHSLLFGDVVFGATSTKRVHLHNFGDLGVKFRFDMPPKLLNTFSVEPSEGYAAPRDDVLLQVKFHPQRSGGSDSHPKRLRCLLDPPYQQEPIELIVQGNGMEQPEDSALQLQFSAEVRERKTQEVTFPPSGKNTSSEPWKVRPVINTEIPAGETFFSCPGEITVPAGGQATIPITYRPLTMTRTATEADEDTSPAKGKKKDPVPPKHVGRLFASTPDGSAFVWTLEGVSNPPGQDKKLTAEVQCKTPHVQSIPLTNWLQQNQRFHVEINLVQPPEATEEIKLNGIGTFDVPAGQAKDYKFNVYAYREGAAVVRIVFTNPKTETSRQTVAAMLRRELVKTCLASPFAKTCAVADKDEFVGYEISFKFVAPKSIDTLRFNTVCRQVATRSISAGAFKTTPAESCQLMPCKVMNPLSSVAKFKCQATHQDFRFSQNEFSASRLRKRRIPSISLGGPARRLVLFCRTEVAPNSEATVDVLFRPVIVGSGEAKLSLSSPELGDFPYTVEYAAKAAGLDKTIVFKAPLGSMDSIQPFRFLHYAQKATTFTATIEAAPGQKSVSSDFAPEIKEVKVDAAGAEGLEASINAAARAFYRLADERPKGASLLVTEVRFTPSELGEIRGLLVLTSPDGGEYKALLMGYAQPPQPQGPVDVPKAGRTLGICPSRLFDAYAIDSREGKPTNVEFQNPFAEPVEFSLQVDNPSFQLTQRAVKLDSKKTVPIPVSFTGDKAQGGRLLVSAGRVIFLQGVP